MKSILLVLILSLVLGVCMGEEDWYYDTTKCWDITSSQEDCLSFTEVYNNHCVWCESSQLCMEYNPCSGTLIGRAGSTGLSGAMNCTDLIMTESSSGSLDCNEFTYWLYNIYAFILVASAGCLLVACCCYFMADGLERLPCGRRSKYERV